MMYLYLGKHTVKVIGMAKTLLGQYNIAHFSKTHSSDFFINGKPQGVDLIASAVKEAVTSSQPEPISDKDVCLILPQELFSFARYTVPTDISDSAIVPFIQDKVRNDLKISLENTYHDFLINRKDGESNVFFFAIDKETFDSLKQAFSLVQLRISRIVPESLAYYTLFEKTLRQDKKENILYATYEERDSLGYLFDSFGLLQNKKYELGIDVKTSLKNIVEEAEREGHKINRLILSGTQSKTVRQDLFTKEVGAWTNPLEKIIENFYKEYIKMIIPNGNGGLSILEFDVCFGGFIFTEEHKDFTLMQQTVSASTGGRGLPGINLSMGWLSGIFNMKTFLIFAISFALSFGIIFALSRAQGSGLSLKVPSFGGFGQNAKPTAKPTPKPTTEPTPTPSVTREELKVKILNGSGIAGKAGEVKEILQDAGYTDIVTDNADSFDYTQTEVQLAESAADALAYIQEDLADYVEITDAATIDDEEETADVIIIVGTDFE
jgi:hypothetical protein